MSKGHCRRTGAPDGLSRLETLNIQNGLYLDRAAFACIAHGYGLRMLSFGCGNFCDADLEPLAALVNLEKLSFR